MVTLIVCPVSTPAKHPVEHLHLNTLLATGVNVVAHVSLKSRSDPIRYTKLLLFILSKISGDSLTIETFAVKRNCQK